VAFWFYALYDFFFVFRFDPLIFSAENDYSMPHYGGSKPPPYQNVGRCVFMDCLAVTNTAGEADGRPCNGLCNVPGWVKRAACIDNTG